MARGENRKLHYCCLFGFKVHSATERQRHPAIWAPYHSPPQDLVQFKRMVDCEEYGAIHSWQLKKDGDASIRFWVREGGQWSRRTPCTHTRPAATPTHPPHTHRHRLCPHAPLPNQFLRQNSPGVTVLPRCM